MKKVLLLCAVLCTSVLSAFAAEKAIENTFSDDTFSEKTNSYTGTWTNNSGTSLIMFAFNNGSSSNHWTEVRCGRKAAASTPTITTENALTEAISKVVINFSQANAAMVKEAYLQVAADTASFAAAAKIAFTVAAGEVVIPITTPAANQCYRITMDLDQDGSNNGTIRITSVNFVYNIADVNATAISIQEGTDIELELYREAQLHAVLTPADATTAVTWASSDPTAVSVSETGVVKALKENDDAYATITATAGTLKATIDVYMVDPVVITPSAAAAKANTISADNGKYEGGEYVIEGYVVSVSTKYDASAKTISLQLADAKGGEAVIEAYKCNVTDETNIPTPEAKVRVIGYLSKYSGKAQVAAGGTVAVLEKGMGAPVDKGATTVAAFLEAKDTYNLYTLTGVVSNISSTSYGNFDLVDATGSIYIYGLKDADGQNCFTAKGIEEGDTITVKGSYTEYNGKAEVVNALYVSHKKGVKVDPEDKGAISVADFIAAADKVNIYTLTGTVSDIWTDKTTGEYNAYGNFDLTDETGTILVYGLLTADGQAKQFASMGIDEGDIVTIKGVYTIYNGEPQIASATYVSHVDKTPSAIENTTANSEKKVRKVVENGQIYILKDGVKYNIFGTKVSK